MSVIPVNYKSGVSLKGVQAVTVIGIMQAAKAFARLGAKQMTVTSVTDGKHKNGSKHYEGLAFDVRTRDFAKEDQVVLVDVLRSVLEDEWDVVLESTHIHIEFDPD